MLSKLRVIFCVDEAFVGTSTAARLPHLDYDGYSPQDGLEVVEHKQDHQPRYVQRREDIDERLLRPRHPRLALGLHHSGPLLHALDPPALDEARTAKGKQNEHRVTSRTLLAIDNQR